MAHHRAIRSQEQNPHGTSVTVCRTTIIIAIRPYSKLRHSITIQVAQSGQRGSELVAIIQLSIEVTLSS